jgi:hypothetical protein
MRTVANPVPNWWGLVPQRASALRGTLSVTNPREKVLVVFKSELRPAVPAVALHEQRLERVPELVAGDAGFSSAHGEMPAHDLRVKRISIPNHSGVIKNNAGSVRSRSGDPVPKEESAC